MSKIRLSVIIATLNAEKTLKKTLESLENQSFKKSEREIIVVDGGSTDNTVKISKMYGCRVINNPKILPAYAKYLGFKYSKGDHILFLDADEELKNNTSIEKKFRILKKNKNLVAVISSGYITPGGSSFTNAYINEFGDPFSKFIYGISKDHRFFIKDMKKRYAVVKENDNMITFDFINSNNLPLIELVAMASMIDKEFFVETFQDQRNHHLITHTFYLLIKDKKNIAIVKNDKVIHYSSENMLRYIKKLRSRIVRNVYNEAKDGYLGRSEFMSEKYKLKKYIFVPYSLSIIPALIESILLVHSRTDVKYMLHLPLTLLTGGLIMYYMALKTIGIKRNVNGYGV